MFNRIHIAINILILTLFMSSCEYKDLDEFEYNTNSVLVDFTWENVDSIPSSFRILFYPILTGSETFIPEIRVFDVYNNHAELKNIYPGKYRITTYNTDTEHIKTAGFNNRKSFEATTPPYFSVGTGETSSLDTLFYGQTIYDTPDYLIHANEEFFEVKAEEKRQLLTLHPDSMVVAVELRVKKFQGLNKVKEIRGTLSNVAKKRFIAYENLTKDTATVMFECKYSERDSMVYSNFYLYGIQPHEVKTAEHVLTLFFWLEDRNIYFKIPVTDVLANFERDDKKVTIDVSDIDINLTDKGSVGAFDIEINDWENVNIDIPW